MPPALVLCITVTEQILRQHLATILQDLNMNISAFSFHSFRRSGATLADNLGIDLEEIKHHGTWKSNAVQPYIVADPHRAKATAQGMKNFLIVTVSFGCLVVSSYQF